MPTLKWTGLGAHMGALWEPGILEKAPLRRVHALAGKAGDRAGTEPLSQLQACGRAKVREHWPALGKPCPSRAGGPGCCSVAPGGISYVCSCRGTHTSMVKNVQPHGTGKGRPWGCRTVLPLWPGSFVRRSCPFPGSWGGAVPLPGADRPVRPAFHSRTWSSGPAAERVCGVKLHSLVHCPLTSGCALGGHLLLASARGPPRFLPALWQCTGSFSLLTFLSQSRNSVSSPSVPGPWSCPYGIKLRT